MSDHWACRHLFAPDGTVLIDKSSSRRHAAGKSHEVWQGLHASPRSAPSKGAKLCTDHCWSACLGPVPEPHFQLPLSDRCLRRLFYIFGLVLTRCPVRWAGGCAWHRLPASALSAQACMWAILCTMFLSALLLMTFVSASSIFLMIVMEPCLFSCGTHARRALLLACCSSLIGMMRF